MIDLKKLVGEKVEIITNDDKHITGYVDAFCAAEDIDGEGGPFVLASHIKSVTLLN